MRLQSLIFLYSYRVFAFFTVVLLTGFNLESYAVVKTQLWLESHRGYSLEQVPGTGSGGVPTEYVAAGTVWANGPGSKPGWHFMRINEFGTVLASRTSYAANTDDEFRVVDITVERQGKYWITIQARQRSFPEFDYIYVAGVDGNGNDIGLNPAIHIMAGTGVGTHRNLYPTHSLYMESALYICGYAADNTETLEAGPHYSSDKIGMFLKCDVNSSPVTTNFYFWNTPNSHIQLADFDMALRISPSQGTGGAEIGFPLLVTGSLNTSGTGYISSVLAMKFNSSGGLITANGYLPSAYAFSPLSGKHGVYGMDVRGPLYPENEEQEGGYAILVNYFIDDSPHDRTWGILRVKNDLTVYNSTTNYSYVSLSGMKSWGTQFTDMYYDDRSRYNIVTVIGQQNHLYDTENICGSINPPNLPPNDAPENVNPFVANIAVTEPTLWDYNNGFGTTFNNSFFWGNVVHLSSKGTAANDMVYRDGSLGVGEYLEDVTRLYTFGAGSHYYTGSATTGQQLPAIVAPVGELNAPPGSNPYLLTKFIKTDALKESTCQNFKIDCPDFFTSTTYEYGGFTSEFYDGLLTHNAYIFFSLNDVYAIPSDLDCSSGYYKPTGVNNMQQQKVKFSPNPASSELNILLSHPLEKSDGCDFWLTDITGRVVFERKSCKVNGMEIHLDLPVLPKGLYIGSVTLNGTKHAEKIIIE